MKTPLFLLSPLCLLAACEEPRTVDSQAAADAVYLNATVYTGDADRSWAQAVAVADGQIVAVGSDAQMQARISDTTQVVDLEGRMLMPGIHDTHIHPPEAGIQKRLQCSFLSNDLLEEVLAILARCLADTPEGEWVRGGQWNDGLLLGARLPKEILDEIAPDHPVFLMDWSVHNAWVNSRALELFKVTGDTPDPSGGVIVRDTASGDATGILLDNAAYDYRRTLPEYPLASRVQALEWSLDQIARYGVTTIKDAIVTDSAMESYHALARTRQLPVRINTSLTWKSSWALSHADEQALIDGRAGHASDMIKTDFAKIMLDGIPPTYTAAMLEPYVPNAAFGDSWLGKLMIEPATLNADVIELDRKGLSIKIHATGDRSARSALDAFAAARAASGNSDIIHEVSHAELIHPDDIPRFKQLNVAAEMCPILWYPIGGLDWEAWLGPERRVWPVRSLVESGALVTYGSDWSVVPTPNPWPGIEAMVTRADPYVSGEATLWPEQAVDLATAIRIFTQNGAIANRAGNRSGSLEVGKDADFIVLDRNVFEVPITDVGETEVVLSVVAGRPVVNTIQ